MCLRSSVFLQYLIAMTNHSSVHVSVMLDEVLAWLEPRDGMTLVDGTLGGGGHTRASGTGRPSGRVIALDRDMAAVEAAM